MGQLAVSQELQQPFEIMGLIPFDAKPLHHVENHLVIISPDLVSAVPLRLEEAGDAQLRGIGNPDAGRFVRHPLRYGDMYLKPLLIQALEVHKTAHGMEQSPGNGNAQPQPAHIPAAPGIRLIEIVHYLSQLFGRHADSRVADIDGQVDAVVLPPESDVQVDAALLRELHGILQQDPQDMGNLVRIADQHRRYFRVDVEHHFQSVSVAVLQRGYGNHIVHHRRDHIGLFCGGQRALHDLRIVQDIVDLAGEAFAGQLDRPHVLPDIRGDVLSQGHFADAHHHVHRGAQFMGHIGQEIGVLPYRRGQLFLHAGISGLLHLSAADAVSGHSHGARHSAKSHHQPHHRPLLRPGADGVEHQKMVQNQAYIERGCHIQQPLSVQQGEQQNHHTGHHGDVIEAG